MLQLIRVCFSTTKKNKKQDQKAFTCQAKWPHPNKTECDWSAEIKTKMGTNLLISASLMGMLTSGGDQLIVTGFWHPAFASNSSCITLHPLLMNGNSFWFQAIEMTGTQNTAVWLTSYRKPNPFWGNWPQAYLVLIAALSKSIELLATQHGQKSKSTFDSVSKIKSKIRSWQLFVILLKHWSFLGEACGRDAQKWVGGCGAFTCGSSKQ